MLNEYLAPDHPIAAALGKLIRRTAQDPEECAAVHEAILEGARLADLPENARSLLRDAARRTAAMPTVA